LAGAGEDAAKACASAREFVTSLEFLRTHEDLKLPEPEARKVAEKVALGCEGAAGRFIRIATLLVRAGLTGKESLQVALRFADREDREAEAFVSIFKRAFAEEYLDLDLGDAVKVALSLSRDFPGDRDAARKEFERLVEFCVKRQPVGLARPSCGGFAARAASKAIAWNGKGASAFEEGYDFLVSASGPNLSTPDALTLSESLLEVGPGAFDNFRQAYLYASSEKGLGAGREESLRFARRITVPADSKTGGKQ
jgi:hypothetical protein